MAHRYDRDKDESLFPVISIDYIADHEMPVLVVHDRTSKSHFAHAVPSKGVSHPYAERALCRDLTRLGYKKVILKSDGEPAITALVRAVQANWQGQVVPGRSPLPSRGLIVPLSAPFKPYRAKPVHSKRRYKFHLVTRSRTPRLSWHGC